MNNMRKQQQQQQKSNIIIEEDEYSIFESDHQILTSSKQIKRGINETNNIKLTTTKRQIQQPANVIIHKENSNKKGAKKSSDYIFNVKLISEDSKNVIVGSEPISVECRKMNNLNGKLTKIKKKK